MSILKMVQLIADSSGLTDTAKGLLENAVSKDAQDQINVLSARAAYLHEKVIQAESVIIDLQDRLSLTTKEKNEAQEKLSKTQIDGVDILLAMKQKYEDAQKELNDLKIDFEEAKLATDKALSTSYQEGFEAGVERGREDANEDRDSTDILNKEKMAALFQIKLTAAIQKAMKDGEAAGYARAHGNETKEPK